MYNLSELSKDYNFKFFLYGGTMLGYARLGDVLPWDDDLDVAIEKKDMINLLKAANDSVRWHCDY